jgi:transitional endoplasmic reticulum ATPase
MQNNSFSSTIYPSTASRTLQHLRMPHPLLFSDRPPLTQMSTTHTSPHYVSAAASTFTTAPASASTLNITPADSTGSASAPEPVPDRTARQYFSHSSAPRVNTDCTIVTSLREQYPGLEPVIVPQHGCNLLAFAAAGLASAEPLEEGSFMSNESRSLKWVTYVPPPRRLNGETGGLGERVLFAKYAYTWLENTFIIYYADGRDGDVGFPQTQNYYILTPVRAAAERLIIVAGQWGTKLHEEILVFDQGDWNKDSELFRSVMKSSWDNVIMDGELKQALIDDHLSFFSSRPTYMDLKVPWKRGIIYYGPPGNGKTISIKATMRMLHELRSPVPTLYVRSFASVCQEPTGSTSFLS